MKGWVVRIMHTNVERARNINRNDRIQTKLIQKGLTVGYIQNNMYSKIDWLTVFNLANVLSTSTRYSMK